MVQGTSCYPGQTIAGYGPKSDVTPSKGRTFSYFGHDQTRISWRNRWSGATWVFKWTFMESKKLAFSTFHWFVSLYVCERMTLIETQGINQGRVSNAHDFCVFVVSSERNPAYTSEKPPPWIGHLPSRVILPVRSIEGTKWKTGIISVDGISILLSVAWMLGSLPIESRSELPDSKNWSSSVSEMVVTSVIRALYRVVFRDIERCSWTSLGGLCDRAPIIDIFFSGCSLPPRFTNTGREVHNRKISRSAVRWTTTRRMI